ncbi:hypothetical protein SKAU_G00310270 [Synaphobranchus kaupii]|uniref:Uncharacterized protein n=1 Tax=Synaphobranchus kaupii TaxID=118154 RepID=A0A9Q1ERQ2_SYNKA|nr:hypothetical protein SKAU_G00310270 [Synaphobranchus kaupii]
MEESTALDVCHARLLKCPKSAVAFKAKRRYSTAPLFRGVEDSSQMSLSQRERACPLASSNVGPHLTVVYASRPHPPGGRTFSSGNRVDDPTDVHESTPIDGNFVSLVSVRAPHLQLTRKRANASSSACGARTDDLNRSSVALQLRGPTAEHGARSQAGLAGVLAGVAAMAPLHPLLLPSAHTAAVGLIRCDTRGQRGKDTAWVGGCHEETSWTMAVKMMLSGPGAERLKETE